MPADSYRTLSAPASAETKVLASRFLAFARPVSTRDAALAFWKDLQKTYHDATHHCFACRLGTGAEDFRWNDDGEPAGTAGKPLLAAIDRRGLTDIIIVVVRYFGGTKLGVGGLRRAYADAAEGVLAGASTEERFLMARVPLRFTYDDMARVLHVLEQAGGKLVERSYDADVRGVAEIRLNAESKLRASLTEATNGRLRFGDT